MINGLGVTARFGVSVVELLWDYGPVLLRIGNLAQPEAPGIAADRL